MSDGVLLPYSLYLCSTLFHALKKSSRLERNLKSKGFRLNLKNFKKVHRFKIGKFLIPHMNLSYLIEMESCAVEDFGYNEIPLSSGSKLLSHSVTCPKPEILL